MISLGLVSYNEVYKECVVITPYGRTFVDRLRKKIDYD